MTDALPFNLPDNNQLTVSGKKKTDDIRETKYEYDGKNQLVAFTDPEGRRETYT